MADEVEEKDDDDWSEAITDDAGVTSKDTSVLQVSSGKMSEPLLPMESKNTIQSIGKMDAATKDAVSFRVTDSAGQRVPGKDDDKPVIPNPRGQPRSQCRARSRNTRQCARQFQEIIGKHEVRNEQLEQLEGDLRQRLQTLECSMPAVMVWNIWRMAQGAPNSAVRRLMEKQFQGFDDMTVSTTPSRHWDDRVRRVEAERKEAQRRAEEARSLLADKEAAVHERRKRLDEAKKCNKERKERMERLAREASELREALKNARGDDNSHATGEIRAEETWLGGAGSASSIASADLECFARLQGLAEAEICMKRQISELERREEAYMRTLQQADEMWSKMEGDTADTVSELQSQLDSKTAANQQLADRICQLEDELESLKKRLIGTKDALSKFADKEYNDAEVGSADAEATVKNRGVAAAVKTAAASATATPKTVDQESLAHPETLDEGSSVVAPEHIHAGVHVFAKQFDKSVEAIPIAAQVHRGIDPATGLVVSVRVGNDEDATDQWKGWNWDNGCPPGAICDDLVESSTGTDDVMTKAVATSESNVEAVAETVERTVGGQDEAVVPEGDQIVLSREELRNWYNIVDSVHHMMAKCDNCSSKTDDIHQLAEQMKLQLRSKGLAGVKTPMIMKEILSEPVIIPGEHTTVLPTPSTEDKPKKIEPAVLTDFVDISDETISHTSQDVARIDDGISPLSAEIEQAVQSDHRKLPVLSEEGVDKFEPAVMFPAEITEVIDLPPATLDTIGAESKSSELLDETKNGPRTQIDVTEKEVVTVEEKITVEKSPRMEEKPTEKNTDHSAVVSARVEPPEILGEDSLTDAPADSLKKSDVALIAPIQLEAESVERPEKLSRAESLFASAEDLADSGFAASELADEIPLEIDHEEKLAVYKENGVSIRMPTENAEESLIFSGSDGDDLKFEDALDTPEQTDRFLPIRDDVEPHLDSDIGTTPTTATEKRPPTTIAPTTPKSEELEVQDEIPTILELQDEIPTILELQDEIPTILGLQDETPTIWEVEDKIPTILEVQDEIPSMSEVQDEIPSVSEVQDEIPSIFEAQDEIPSIFEAQDEIPSILNVEDQILSILDVEGEIPSIVDLKDDQSVLELIIRSDVDTHLSTTEKVPDDTEQVPQLFTQVPDAEHLQELKSDEVSTLKPMEAEPQSTVIVADGRSQLEPAVSEAGVINVKVDSTIEPKVPEVRSHTDANELKRAADKLEKDVSSERKIIRSPDRPRVGKPYLAVAKVESAEKLTLPKPVAQCICKPPTCPLLGRVLGRDARPHVRRIGIAETQTAPLASKTSQRRADKQKLKTISEGTCPSPEVRMWRQGTVRTKRARDKSMLTTVCVDTQTHRALVRGKLALGGDTRKDACTCSGACPKKTEHGGCTQRLPTRSPDEQQPAPVVLTVVGRSGCTKPPTSVTSTLEKEIAVVKYTERSLALEDSEDWCVECRRPMTPEGTAISVKSTLPTGSQKSVIASLKKTTSSMTRMTYESDNYSCCECKTSSKLKTVNTQDACCFSSSQMSKKLSAKSSKTKRKPKTKNQAVMANIPKSVTKITSKETGFVDDKVKSPVVTMSTTISDVAKIKTVSEVSSLSKESYCECEESSNDPSLADDEGTGASALVKTANEDLSCDCLLNDSVSKGSSCDCAEH